MKYWSEFSFEFENIDIDHFLIKCLEVTVASELGGIGAGRLCSNGMELLLPLF